MDSDDALVSAGLIFVNTNMAAAVASVVTMIYTWLRYKKPDVGMTLNAALAGLVAITAGCDVVSPVGAAIIGIIAGILLPISINFFDAVLKIDDPVGAISVHGVCGAAGTLLTGLFAVDGGAFTNDELQQAEAHIAQAIVANYPMGCRKFPYFKSKKELLSQGETYILDYIDDHDDYGPVVMQVMNNFADLDQGLLLGDLALLKAIHLTQETQSDICRVTASVEL